MHICVPTNLQYVSLWQEIITSIKQYGKTEIKNIMKNTYADFLSVIACKCGRVVLSRASVYFVISKLILLFSYIFSFTMHYNFQRLFYIARSMFPFLFNRPQSKASVDNQMSHLLFEAEKYFFVLFNFLKMLIYRTLFQRIS